MPSKRLVSCTATAVLVAGLTLTTAPAAYAADPAGCTRTPKPGGGQTITCTQGIPAGQTLDGTTGPDTITITGTVYGTLNDQGGADDITITGISATTPGTAGAPAIGSTGTVNLTGPSTLRATGGNAVPAPGNVYPTAGGGDGNQGTINAANGSTVRVTGGTGTGPFDSSAGGTGNSGKIVGAVGATVHATGGPGVDRSTPVPSGSAGSAGGGGVGNSGSITGTTVTATGGKGGDVTAPGEGNAGDGGNGNSIPSGPAPRASISVNGTVAALTVTGGNGGSVTTEPTAAAGDGGNANDYDGILDGRGTVSATYLVTGGSAGQNTPNSRLGFRGFGNGNDRTPLSRRGGRISDLSPSGVVLVTVSAGLLGQDAPVANAPRGIVSAISTPTSTCVFKGAQNGGATCRVVVNANL
ncbi:hypothetical protein ACFVW2_35080 [Streptomyces sp. NPDC058171]